MRDLQGRVIDYMRVSITDRCNLRCKYCMPERIPSLPKEEILTFSEILAVCRQAADLGIRKIKITGGEPLVRKGCTELIGELKQLPGIAQVTMTTNGLLLSENLEGLVKAGLDGVNISLDTLDGDKFEQITGFQRLDAVLASIDWALDTELKVKVNTVLQPGVNEDEWESLLLLTKERKLDVRFIEMMPVGRGRGCSGVSNQELFQRIKARYPGVKQDGRIHGNGPAAYVQIPGFAGSVGFISAIHGRFCNSCNRIRMTAAGDIKPCLCYQESLSVRKAVRAGRDDEARDILKRAILMKPAGHCFEQPGDVTELRKMVQIRG